MSNDLSLSLARKQKAEAEELALEEEAACVREGLLAKGDAADKKFDQQEEDESVKGEKAAAAQACAAVSPSCSASSPEAGCNVFGFLMNVLSFGLANRGLAADQEDLREQGTSKRRRFGLCPRGHAMRLVNSYKALKCRLCFARKEAVRDGGVVNKDEEEEQWWHCIACSGAPIGGDYHVCLNCRSSKSNTSKMGKARRNAASGAIHFAQDSNSVEACNLVVEVLRRHGPGSERVAADGLYAVRAICSKYATSSSSSSGRMSMSDAGACSVVVDTLRAHLCVPRVCVYGCGAIAELAKDNLESASILGGVGACQEVVEAIRAHASYDVKVAEYGCEAMHSLARFGPSENIRFLKSAGAVHVLTAISTSSTLSKIAKEKADETIALFKQ